MHETSRPVPPLLDMLVRTATFSTAIVYVNLSFYIIAVDTDKGNRSLLVDTVTRLLNRKPLQVQSSITSRTMGTRSAAPSVWN